MAKLGPGYRIDALVVTSDGDSLVTRYILTADVLLLRSQRLKGMRM
jgi:hypothetical protein